MVVKRSIDGSFQKDEIMTHLCSANYPSRETFEAIQNLWDSENLTEAKDLNDLFKKLDI